MQTFHMSLCSRKIAKGTNCHSKQGNELFEKPPRAQHPRLAQNASDGALALSRASESHLALHRTGQQPVGGSTGAQGPAHTVSCRTHGLRLSSAGPAVCVLQAGFVLYLL